MKTIVFNLEIGVCENEKYIFDIDSELTEQEIKDVMEEWLWNHFRCKFREVNPNPLGELQDKKALEERIMGTVVVEDFGVAEGGEKKDGMD